ncbi:protein translocase subunit secF/protein translocase subunit secD [Chthonomonas calidirosea]|uniref:protein translocase subunit SecD n=1 Tax=Chthonomonas calidirosea TaxID=454171 RepID=UPI0006DD38BD|nr:protein translocase subunit SecD [Chthonomonas calidirosea]CEK16375.1 protein translocase subunit secF/protein translocase subunit secD [Chthonomonas calidirosea]
MTTSQNRRMLLLILVLAIFSIFVSVTKRDWHIGPFHLDTRPRYGLDIRGGLRVVLHPDVDLYNKEHPGHPWGPEQLSLVRHIIENRVNFSGVTEPLIITRPETNQIIVELPGVRDRQAAINELKATADLRFYLLPQLGSHDNSRPAIWHQEIQKDPKTGAEVDVLIDNQTGKPVTPQELQEQVFDNPNLLVATGADLLPNCEARLDPITNKPILTFQFNDKGSAAFEQATRANIGRYLGIFLDNRLLTAPYIESVISGQGQIEGIATLKEAKALADELNAGALPVPLQLQEVRSLEATLGQEAVHTTTIAGVWGLVLVLLFMLIWYRLPGLLADVALILYAFFSIAIFKLIPVTFTLPGIAGFILSIGMAVDANILIFERFKEELRAGQPLRAAIDAGFNRAFSAIFDSNVCTVITCCVLYYFGTGPIRGFALTLGFGVAVSMFTAITVTRTFLFALVNFDFARNEKMYGLSDRAWNLHVMRWPWLWLGISALVIVPGMIAWGMGGIKPSIDFKGGTEITLSYKTPHTAAEIERILIQNGYKDSRVVISEEPNAPIDKHLAIVTTRRLTNDQRIQLIDALTHNGADLVPGTSPATVPYADVSGTVSRQLTEDAVKAVIIAELLIVFYLAFRFAIGGFLEGLQYGICAVLALIHDVAVLWGSFAILGLLYNWQIDSLFVTAMLTVIGFSVHDTIIIFDRIRENLLHRARGETFSSLVDRSINQTFSRSIKTSFTVILVLLALFIFGSSEIHQFAAALLIGIISGTYSSIFNASVLLVLWKRFRGQDKAVAPILATPSTSVSTKSVLSVPGDRPIVTPKAEPEVATTPASTSGTESGTTGSTESKAGARRRRPVRRRRM